MQVLRLRGLVLFAAIAGMAVLWGAQAAETPHKGRRSTSVRPKQQRVAADNDRYSSSFFMFGVGGGSSSSSKYNVTDRVTEYVPATEPQQGGRYHVVDVLAAPRVHANNGLVSTIGTTVKLSWGEEGKPPNSMGYVVNRSTTTRPGSYERINVGFVTEPHYEDIGLAEGTYFYVIYLVRSDMQQIQWTAPLVAHVNPSGVRDWMLYDASPGNDLTRSLSTPGPVARSEKGE